MIIISIIGMMDSGLGAISVFNELIKQQKYANYFLLLDYRFNPFGEKTEKQLYERLQKGIQFLKKKKAQQIVLACNTLSSVALKRNIKDVITPVPYFQEVLQSQFDEHSLLLATNYTIKENLYAAKARPSSDLVRYIEGSKKVNWQDIEKDLKGYQKLFLGCTHFNLIKHKLMNYKLLDSGTILANHLSIEKEKLQLHIYLTAYNINIVNHIKKHIHLNHYFIHFIDEI